MQKPVTKLLMPKMFVTDKDIVITILQNMDNGKFPCGVFIDLKKLLILLTVRFYWLNLKIMVLEV